jgi:HlyD family secretion protein
MPSLKPASYVLALCVVTGGAVFLGAAGVFSFAPTKAYSEPPLKAASAWAAAAPGRVEPKGQELRIGAPSPGVILDVLVELNDRVKAGDLLIRLDDGELKAKLEAAKAEAAVRAAERDKFDVKGTALERRKAEDGVYAAERAHFDARTELDKLFVLSRKEAVPAADLEQGREAILSAAEKLDQEQANLKRVTAKTLQRLTREEAALAAARAEVTVVSAALDRMHIRSPISAAVLELRAKAGETAGPSAETPLVVLGDTAHLQVRAEIEERDVGKVHKGQAAIVKSDAFPDRSFEARVAVIAQSLGAPQLTARTQRKQTDVEVLEVVLDLAEGVPLLPGMRTDVLFKQSGALAKNSIATNE